MADYPATQLSTDPDVARFFELSVDALCIAGTDGYFKRVSPSFVRLLGYSEEELTGRPWLDFVHPDDAAVSERAAAGFSDGRKVFNFTNRYRHADGSYRTLEWSASIPDGEEYIYAVARDITDRRRQAELMEQTHRATGVGGWELDLKTGHLSWTSETYRLHETSPEAYTPTVETAIAFYAPESVPVISEAIERAREHGEAYDVELQLITAQGNRIWVRATGEVESAPDGPVRLFGSFQDITGQRSRELMRRRFETMSKLMPDFVGIATPDMAAQYVNRSGLDMVGRDSYEGTLVSDYHPDWALEKFANEAMPSAMRDGFWKGELALRHVDGHEIPVHMMLMVTKDANGEMEFASCIMRDLSEQKGLERQLLQSQKLEAVGQLAGGIAHDFNNLLTTILGNAEFATTEIEAAHPAHARLSHIIGSAERGASLTSQLLGFARAQITKPRVLDLNELLEDAEKLLRHLLDESIELVTRPADSLWAVRADPAQLEQVLLNLAVNARDAMPRGGQLRITSRNTVGDGALAGREFVELLVEDTGEGMPQVVLDQVFEPFFTTKEVGKGSGLGLSMCHGIVQQNEGHIWLDSTPGIGTQVHIWLPRSMEAASAEAATAEPDAAQGTGTILVVEDEEAVLQMVLLVLDAQGFDVLGATTAAEALSLAEAHAGKIDLLLTDVVLPGMDGRQLANAFTAMQPDTKVLFVSGYSRDCVADRGVLPEGVHFLQKPYRPSELTAEIQRILAE